MTFDGVVTFFLFLHPSKGAKHCSLYMYRSMFCVDVENDTEFFAGGSRGGEGRGEVGMLAMVLSKVLSVLGETQVC
jgi:hypothetical protein